MVRRPAGILLFAILLFIPLCEALAQQAAPPRPVTGPPAAARPPAARAPQRPPLQSPFRLSEDEQRYLDQVLVAWQNETDKIKTFKCKFTRWKYNPTFAIPQFKDKPLEVHDGEIKYASPDKGTFKVSKIQHMNTKSGEYEVPKGEYGEHWVCDGEAIWEHDHRNRQVIERPIPPDMQGEAIRNSPLPFLFGSKAVDLKQRYFMRIVTPREHAQKEVWVDAFPRHQQDAANFKRAILRLSRSDFRPIALRVYDPGNEYVSYEFAKIVINDPLGPLKQIFAAPRVPFGYRKVLELPPEETASRPAPAAQK